VHAFLGSLARPSGQFTRTTPTTDELSVAAHDLGGSVRPGARALKDRV
jgi:hypothetical protein